MIFFCLIFMSIMKYIYTRLKPSHWVRQDVIYLSSRCELLRQTCMLYPAYFLAITGIRTCPSLF